MKKQLRKFLCGMICLVMMLSGVNVFAVTSESPMDPEWRGDYSDNTDPKLIIEFISPALYKQQVSIVMYPKPEQNESVTSSKYVYINEVTAGAGQTKTVTINILDRYPATDGVYVIELKGSGNMSTESTGSATVNLIKPSEIPGLLNEFKNATTSTFLTVFNKVIPALQLAKETDPDREEERVKIMFSIQKDDYAGEFSNLENIRDAWNMSDVIKYITDSDVRADGIKSRIEANSDLIGIDTTETDYKAYINTVCEDIRLYNGEYNGGKGVLSVKDLYGIIKQYIGMHAINAATEETLYNTFETYKDYFGLPAEQLEKYNSKDFIRADRDKALRSLYQQGFEKNSELVTAFVEGVNGVGNNTGNSEPPTTIVPPSDGESPSAGMTGGISAPVTPSVPAQTGFKDVQSNHWAYSYVTKLAANGTISGYDDGTFKPNNNVTREEFVKMIISATGLLSAGAQCDFEDVAKDAWFYSYVASGYEKEIVSGVTDTLFGVGRNITRQDVAVIAARILTYLDAEIPELSEVTLTDIDSVSDYAQESVKLLNGIGIIGGFDDGSFMPHNALTRAEAAAIISRLTANL